MTVLMIETDHEGTTPQLAQMAAIPRANEIIVLAIEGPPLDGRTYRVERVVWPAYDKVWQGGFDAIVQVRSEVDVPDIGALLR